MQKVPLRASPADAENWREYDDAVDLERLPDEETSSASLFAISLCSTTFVEPTFLKLPRRRSLHQMLKPLALRCTKWGLPAGRHLWTQAHDLGRDASRQGKAHFAGKLVVDERLANDVVLADSGQRATVGKAGDEQHG